MIKLSKFGWFAEPALKCQIAAVDERQTHDNIPTNTYSAQTIDQTKMFRVYLDRFLP